MSPKPRAFDLSNKTAGRRSKKHEDRLAEVMGGLRLPRSGGLSPSKWTQRHTAGGDISTKEFLIEHKATSRQSLGLKKVWLEKVSEGAKRVMKHPALVVTFDQDQPSPQDWVLIPMSVFEKLRGRK